MEDPRDRLRRQLAEQLAPLVAEAAVKVDKGSTHMTLLDLRSDRAAAIYLEEAHKFLMNVQRRIDVQAAQAHKHALAEKPNEDVAVQARQDVVTYGSGRTH